MKGPQYLSKNVRKITTMKLKMLLECTKFATWLAVAKIQLNESKMITRVQK